MSIYYRAAWVFPVNIPPINEGWVEVDNGVVIRIGSKSTAPPGFQDAQQQFEVHDLGNVALLPGLVNSHTHLEFSELSTPVGDPSLDFDAWITEVVKYRREKAAEGVEWLEEMIALGAGESREVGVIGIGEITTSNSLLDCYSKLKTRIVSLLEVINYSAEQVSDVTTGVQDYLTQAAISGVNAGISPHAPYTVHWEQLKSLCELSKDFEVPCVMHLAETAEECALIQTRSGPLREMLERLGMWEEAGIPVESSFQQYIETLASSWRALIVHGNYLKHDDWELLGKLSSNVSVCYCPRTHHYFRHPTYALEEMLAAGVRVCLGTDSRASNPDLNLLAEVEFVRNEYPNLNPSTLLEMVTVNAAFALGLETTHGFIGTDAVASVLSVSLTKEEAGASELACLSAVLARLSEAQLLRL